MKYNESGDKKTNNELECNSSFSQGKIMVWVYYGDRNDIFICYPENYKTKGEAVQFAIDYIKKTRNEPIVKIDARYVIDRDGQVERSTPKIYVRESMYKEDEKEEIPGVAVEIQKKMESIGKKKDINNRIKSYLKMSESVSLEDYAKRKAQEILLAKNGTYESENEWVKEAKGTLKTIDMDFTVILKKYTQKGFENPINVKKMREIYGIIGMTRNEEVLIKAIVDFYKHLKICELKISNLASYDNLENKRKNLIDITIERLKFLEEKLRAAKTDRSKKYVNSLTCCAKNFLERLTVNRNVKLCMNRNEELCIERQEIG